MCLITHHEDADACVRDVVEPVGLSYPTVSHHLEQLTDAGLVRCEHRGRRSYYQVSTATPADAVDALGWPTGRSCC